MGYGLRFETDMIELGFFKKNYKLTLISNLRRRVKITKLFKASPKRAPTADTIATNEEGDRRGPHKIWKHDSRAFKMM